MKKYYIGAFVPEESGGFSVYFPDIPNCVTAGETVDECLEYGEDALRIILQDMAERKLSLPVPSSLEEAKEKVCAYRALDGLNTPENTVYQFFPAPSLDYTPIKITVSLAKSVLEEVDKKAGLAGMTRSGFIAKAAQAYEV